MLFSPGLRMLLELQILLLGLNLCLSITILVRHMLAQSQLKTRLENIDSEIARHRDEPPATIPFRPRE